jgi:hypothetical protein
VKRVLLAVAVVAAITFGFAAPAQAHTTNDWTRGGLDSFSGARQADFSLKDSAGRVVATGLIGIRWDGYDVDLDGSVQDDRTDGYCAILQIRYEIYDGGKWVGHWHYREPVTDCTTNGYSEGSPTYLSRYPTRHVQARACIGDSDGNPSRCESTWH